MKNKNLKWILMIIVNIILVLLLSSLFTYVIGFLAKADKGTNGMVLIMGLMLVIPAIVLNILFLIPTIFVKEKWARVLLTYLPVSLSLMLILLGLNAAWTPLALFFSILIANTIWLYGLKKQTANKNV